MMNLLIEICTDGSPLTIMLSLYERERERV